jgi:hypothetical protein
MNFSRRLPGLSFPRLLLVAGLVFLASGLPAAASASLHSVYEDFFARPQFQVYFTKHLLPESSLSLDPSLIVLPGPSGGRWACKIPDVLEEAEEEQVEWRDPEEERKDAENRLAALG